MLAERYRIVGLLGRGGMGEVYRADDLKLGQSVALKLLPASMSADPRVLHRFHEEVRIAREVSHPNVCRTYDIGEVDGEHFISMEYVDGEDLASLVRRIGRLPRDKGIQIARQICAGLAAAHDKGVLHRDLKPANIMLDGRGHVRITDFGIAAIAEQVEPRDVRSGTPAYMAPEQLAGAAVTERSDLYSLGLVLYEIFTGREAYDAATLADLDRLRRSGTPATPSSIVADMDPTVERLILRCLEHDPRNRPPSAIAVAAALPGGDPLAMALEAGETPSPEMVAASGEAGGLRPGVAVMLLALLIVFATLSSWLMEAASPREVIPLDKPPEVLRDRALAVLASIGVQTPPGDVAAWFEAKEDWHLEQDLFESRAEQVASLSNDRPPMLPYALRTGQNQMVRYSWTGRVTWTRPPFDEPGMTRLRLDTRGHLLSLEIVGPTDLRLGLGDSAANDSVTPVAPTPPNWTVLFEAAGLNQDDFTPSEATFIPPVPCDQLLAWRGVWSVLPEIELGVEAGSLRGEVVYFRQVGPWDLRTPAPPPPQPFVFVLAISLVLVVPLMVRNLRARRADQRGAFRFAVFAFLIMLGRCLFLGDFAFTIDGIDSLGRAMAAASGVAVATWAMYIAIEPYARRYWPQSLISWSRLLSGRWSDPRIGRDVLVGAMVGAIILCVPYLGVGARDSGGQVPLLGPVVNHPDALLGGRHTIGLLFVVLIQSVPQIVVLFFVLLVLRMVFRSTVYGAVAFVLLLTGISIVGWGPLVVPRTIVMLVLSTAAVVVMVRFGLLSLVAFMLVWNLLEQFSPTFDLSNWYAARLAIGPLTVLALGLYGFWVSLAGQPIFRDELAG